MAKPEKPNSPPATELKGVGKNNNNNTSYSGQKLHYLNLSEGVNPDAATIRDQWQFAIKQYNRWYFQAWGTAILAEASLFALSWIIKGENLLPSFTSDHNITDHPPSPDSRY